MLFRALNLRRPRGVSFFLALHGRAIRYPDRMKTQPHPATPIPDSSITPYARCSRSQRKEMRRREAVWQKAQGGTPPDGRQ